MYSTMFMLMELGHFGRFCQGGCRRHPARDHLSYLIKVTRTHLALVLRSRIAVLLQGKFGLLQLGVGGHTMIAIAMGEFKHAVVEGVEASQGDELELVAHLAKLLLEMLDGLGIELLFPVKGGRTV